jgi:hypothetical protein
MKRTRILPLVAVAVVVVALATRTAHAQPEPSSEHPSDVPAPTPPPTPPPPPPPPPSPIPPPPPPLSTEEVSPGVVPPKPDAPDNHVKRGLALGLRLGFALPVGTAAGAAQKGAPGVSQSSTVGIMLPLWLDAGYRFNQRWYAGAYFQMGYASSGGSCGSGCSGYDVRFGLGAEYHAAPTTRSDGWFGMGAGYEILHQSQTNVTTAYRGAELAALMAGLDVRVGQGSMRLGPFGGVALGVYDHLRELSSNSDVAIEIPNVGVHGWIFAGVRGRYDL